MLHTLPVGRRPPRPAEGGNGLKRAEGESAATDVPFVQPHLSPTWLSHCVCGQLLSLHGGSSDRTGCGHLTRGAVQRANQTGIELISPVTAMSGFRSNARNRTRLAARDPNARFASPPFGQVGGPTRERRLVRPARKVNPFVGRRVISSAARIEVEPCERGAVLDLWRLRCALGDHEYSFGGITLGNRLDRCLCCGKVRLCPAATIATVHRLSTIRRRQRRH